MGLQFNKIAFSSKELKIILNFVKFSKSMGFHFKIQKQNKISVSKYWTKLFCKEKINLDLNKKQTTLCISPGNNKGTTKL